MGEISPIPDGYGTVTAYLVCHPADKALTFYEQAFGATVTMCLKDPTGRIAHAELEIGTARIMVADEHPEFGTHAPTTLGGSPVSFVLYTEELDRLVEQSVSAGATLNKPATLEFYGDRVARITDPFGFRWSLASRVEDVSEAEMQRRLEAMFENA